MTTTPAIESLLGLGFTETEAQVYCALARDGAASGYKLAKATGKARANVYQALSTLAQKGAVLSEGVDVQVFRATAPAELTAALQHAFEARTQAARDALERLASPEADDR